MDASCFPSDQCNQNKYRQNKKAAPKNWSGHRGAFGDTTLQMNESTCQFYLFGVEMGTYQCQMPYQNKL